MKIHAIHDRGCLRGSRFAYHFPDVLSPFLLTRFPDCEVVLLPFSNTVPLARDLLRVKSQGVFRADFIIGANRAVVHFEESAGVLATEAMDGFARRLRAMGYGEVVYSPGPSPACDRCAAGIAKGCLDAPSRARKAERSETGSSGAFQATVNWPPRIRHPLPPATA